MLMADYEWVKYDSYHRNISDSARRERFDPSAAPTSSNYNWSSKQHRRQLAARRRRRLAGDREAD